VAVAAAAAYTHVLEPTMQKSHLHLSLVVSELDGSFVVVVVVMPFIKEIKLTVFILELPGSAPVERERERESTGTN
jgi:hypothetical protein